MTDVSILLPSIRPALARQRIDQFAKTATAVDYEIVVVSPFVVSGPRVVHVQEIERRGVIHAMNEAYRHASAPIVLLWSDDARPLEGSLARMLDFVLQQAEPALAGFRKRAPGGRESEQWSVYGHLYVGWLCASKASIEAAGGLFDPEFRNYWADPDLSLRIHEIGGRVAICPDAWLEIDQAADEVKQSNLSGSFEKDTETFFGKWQSRMGRTPRHWWQVNTPVPYDLDGWIRHWLRKVPGLKQANDIVRAGFGRASN
ncbi:hypothetical protein RPPS3_40720 [Rhodopseudomonas palustris]|uniref:glycosyltransferase family 2 protein n=1 Tax=Rhodopseudomonas palustris TaxID=1076 RepID=UPI000D216391|nr:hypothetical protein [Rhodopseudomonas palustris]AVT78134.1 hypothetical protein RPPS3_40720 [Rhodopseudomonas palustris]